MERSAPDPASQFTPRYRTAITGLAAAAAMMLIALPASAQPSPGQPSLPEVASVEQEVIAGILSQPLGNRTVSDLNLPSEFVQRVANRLNRASFQQRSRIVLPTGAASGLPQAAAAGTNPLQLADASKAEYAPAGPLAWAIVIGSIVAIIAWAWTVVRKLREEA